MMEALEKQNNRVPRATFDTKLKYVPITPVPPPPLPTGPPPLKRMLNIWIEMNEGNMELCDYSGRKFMSWTAFELALKTIYDKMDITRRQQSAGYYKTYTTVMWEGGINRYYRIDVGYTKGNFNPYRDSIGEFVKQQSEEPERNELCFEDSVETQMQNISAEDIAPNPYVEETDPTIPPLVLPPLAAEAPFNLTPYSKWSFAIFGEGTRAFKDQLGVLGHYCRLDYPKKGSDEKRKGWVFPNGKREEVEAILSGRAPVNEAPVPEGVKVLIWAAAQGWTTDNGSWINDNDFSQATAEELYQNFLDDCNSAGGFFQQIK